MWYERDLDARMERTRGRPLPAGRMDPGTALGFGAVLAVASVALLGLAANWLAAALLAGAILFYVFVYTVWLKRRTPYNIVIGGAAGAVPPAIGWAAATGELHPLPILLFAVVLMWDAAALLGAVAVPVRTTTAAPACPMLPVVARPREHAPAHPRLHAGAAAAEPGAGGAGLRARALRLGRGAAGRRLRRPGGGAVAAPERGPGQAPVRLLDRLPVPALPAARARPRVARGLELDMPIGEEHRRRRGRNFALAGALVALIVVFYLVTLARFGAP